MEIISIENAFSAHPFVVQQSDRLHVPYGDYKHARGLQKFHRESASLLAANLTDSVPIYRGHPDAPGRPDSNPSAPALGWVHRISPGASGADFHVKMGADGAHAIADAHYRYYSPHWDLRPVAGGIQPVKLRSMGLTNNPNIKVPAIANDDLSERDEWTRAQRAQAVIASQKALSYDDRFRLAMQKHPELFSRKY